MNYAGILIWDVTFITIQILAPSIVLWYWID